ncbi:MAG: zf-TFIIB domain-containing protein [Deltaproteobacteria bacterium]|nr:zf-TFIIB domain-containing protein [Deltaproteobacteria bacterium]
MIVLCDACGRQYDVSGYAPGEKVRCACGTILTVPRQQSLEAAVLHCSSCGGPLEEGADRCPYCGGVVDRDQAKLTLVCPSCFARIPGTARFCSHCGLVLHPQKIEAVSDRALSCPRCAVPLRRRTTDGLDMYECPECCGLWLGNDDFDAVRRKKVAEFEQYPVPREETKARRLEPVLYLKCPECGVLMNRVNFAKRSGVIIDQCREHGVWLDDEELERIARFISEGGLVTASKAQARETSRLAEQRSFMAPMQGSVDTGWQSPDTPVSLFGSLMSALFK